VSRDNDAWMTAYRAGMQAAQEEYAAAVVEQDRSAVAAELLRIERDDYADRAYAAEQELRGWVYSGRERSGMEAEAGWRCASPPGDAAGRGSGAPAPPE
jgi:hypothetical protein